jgi:plasmid stabilization system protein ParE
MVAAVNRSLGRLRDFPLIGSRPREFPGLPLRQVIVEPYRFLYIIEADGRTVTIVDVWHGAQLPVEPELPAP